VAPAVTKLLASYTARHGSLTTESLDSLIKALINYVLAADSLTAW
jgi:hypothetical protein